MEELNEKLLDAFQRTNRHDVQKYLEDGADKQIVLDYVKKYGGWKLTLGQGWILKDLFYN